MSNETPLPTTTIRDYHLNDARAILNKLADRAWTYGQVITWTEEPFEKEVWRNRWDGKRISVIENWVRIFVDGGAPRLGKFKFVAVLERLQGGSIVKAVPGEEVGEEGSNWDGHCDHCHSKRPRIHGYVIEDENGRKIVGKSCVRDYLGMDTPEKLLGVLNQVVEIGGWDDEERFGGGHWSTSTLGVVAASRAAISMFGYAKRDSDNPTAALVRSLSNTRGKKTFQEQKLWDEFYNNGDLYQEGAEKVIVWARTMDPKGDYLNNIKVTLASDYVREKQFGIAVSAALAYDNEQARLRRIEDAKANHVASAGYVGVLKKRMTMEVTVEKIIAIDNQWGCYRIFIFRTENGCTLKWTTSNDTDTSVNGNYVKTGDKVRMTFTPIKHDMYKEDMQTSVNRCKMEALADA